MADGKTCDEVAHDEVSVTLAHLKRFTEQLHLSCLGLHIAHRALGVPVVVQEDPSQHLLLVGQEGAYFVDRHLLEYHIILREGASLVRKDVLDAAQLFWNLAVAGDGALDLRVVVDLV